MTPKTTSQLDLISESNGNLSSDEFFDSSFVNLLSVEAWEVVRERNANDKLQVGQEGDVWSLKWDSCVLAAGQGEI